MRIAAKSAAWIASLALGALAAASVLADPPRHAPAHGWRNKHEHDRDYVGYGGRHWDDDYEVLSGRCNREAIATVVGGVTGGALASQVAKPENRLVATLIGAAAGALIGNRVGRELDEACFGHALELGRPGRLVVWTNEASGVRYEMKPGDQHERHGAICRAFVLTTISGRHRSSRSGVACRTQVGGWQLDG